MRSAEGIFTEFAKQALADYSKNDCPFCTGRSDLLQNDEMIVRVSSLLGSIEVLTQHPQYIPINYCPKCGRTLKEVN